MTNDKPLWAILLAGGTGNRYDPHRSKLLALLDGEPVFRRSFETLQKLPALQGMVIVAHPEWQEAYENTIQFIPGGFPLRWVCNGGTRRDSVWNALQALPEEAKLVVIHDAARPLVRLERIQEALSPVMSGEAVGTSLGVPSQDTLKQVASEPTPWVETTLDRSVIWQVHTPQVFLRDLLEKAHQTIPKTLPIRDDAELVERYSTPTHSILMIQDDPFNLKITTKPDLDLAQAWLTCLKIGR